MLFKAIGFVLYIGLYFQTCNAINDYPAETLRSAFFKCLPIMQLVFIAMSTTVKSKGHTSYKNNILVGLFFSIAGDVSLIWREKLFVAGLLFFAIAQYFYIRAFGMRPRGSSAIMISCVMLAAFTYLYLHTGITSVVMKGLVVMYALLIFSMLWRAWIQMQANPSVGAACAVLGAFIFIVSDLLIASDKWVMTMAGTNIYVMVTYYMAQLLITASVSYYKPHPYREDDKLIYSYKERLN